MKIILSTDFTDENKVLLPYAIDFLKDAGGEIIIFHAYMDNVFVGSNCFPGNMDTDNYFTTELLIELEKNSQEVMKEKTEYLVTTTHTHSAVIGCLFRYMVVEQLFLLSYKN